MIIIPTLQENPIKINKILEQKTRLSDKGGMLIPFEPYFLRRGARRFRP